MSKLSGILTIAMILMVIFFSSIFVIDEGHLAIVTRLGEIKTNAKKEPVVLQPGLHFKMPVLESVLRFDIRIQTLAIDKARIMTMQKKDVLVDYYVKWQITDLPTYFISTSGNKLQAEQLLTQQANNALRAEFGKRDIQDVVSDARSEIMSTLQKSVNISAEPLGIKVVDVRIKSIDLPDEVSTAVFNRMRAERARVAAEHRSKGQAMAEAIRAKADADATVMVAKATTLGAKLRAKGDLSAGKIYSAAYRQDPGFYSFYQSLETYRKSFATTNDVVVLDTRNDFLKYFNGGSNEHAVAAKKV
jgi:membrane protease subunit HflC